MSHKKASSFLLFILLSAIASDISAMEFTPMRMKRTPTSKAMVNNDTTALSLLINENNINTPDENNVVPLHQALTCMHLRKKHRSIKTDIETIEFLLKLGADVNTLDATGDAPVHRAINLLNSTVVEMLLKSKNINQNILNKKNQTPLSLCFSVLITRGALVAGRQGKNAIKAAPACDVCPEIFIALLHSNASIAIQDNEHKTVINWLLEEQKNDKYKAYDHCDASGKQYWPFKKLLGAFASIMESRLHHHFLLLYPFMHQTI